MITLGFRFPAGRYHATPWGHQVNEGLVEWPACPWRVLRALLSAGYTRLAWGQVVPGLGRTLLEALSSEPPNYYVPSANVAHSRHYMPVARFQTGKQLEATTLVLDSWANVDQDELQIQWNLQLSAEQRALLGSLVDHMNYLGRSESWAVGRLLPDDEVPRVANVAKHESGAPLDRGEEIVSLLSPISAEDYATWRAQRVPRQEVSGKKKQTAKQMKERQKIEAPYPGDLLEAMQWDTARWQSFGWTQPPGSQLVQYKRPRGTLSSTAKPRAAVSSSFGPADMILLAVASESGSLGLLPSVSRTLPQAELLHDAVVRLACSDGQVPPEELTGKGADGKPLAGHRHSHVLPLDLDRDGHLDHILFWAKMGFSRPAQEAVTGLRKTFTKGGNGALHLAVAGRTVQSETAQWPEGLERFVTRSQRWVSETPFVAPRFAKKSGRNTLEGQIRSELASRGLPDPVRLTVNMVPTAEDGTERLTSRFRHFVRTRSRGGKAPAQDAGWYVEMEFAEDVTGPICIGYGCHFGLGVMRTGDTLSRKKHESVIVDDD